MPKKPLQLACPHRACPLVVEPNLPASTASLHRAEVGTLTAGGAPSREGRLAAGMGACAGGSRRQG